MKTIRQIADEIGVSKTAVNKQIANLGLRSGLRKNGNQFAIDEHQEALIKQAFSEKSQTEIENQSQTKTQTENHEVGDLVCVLQATIDTLQGQLEVKDRQIEQQAQTITRLTDALAAAQQTAVAAQALHAGTIQQQLVAGEGEELQQERETVPRRSWWKRLFEGKIHDKRVDKRLQAVQCLTGNKIKIIACITMLIDHFSKIFLESIMNDKLFPLYLAGGMSTEQFYGIDAFQKNILNGIGTIAFPLFCLLLSEGFFYTKNRKRYIGGMLAFALISEVPFDIGFFSRYSIAEGTFPFYLQYQNVFSHCFWDFLRWLL